MGPRDAWLKAFPIQQTSKAVDVLTEAWQEMASHPKPFFNHDTREPGLTLALTDYLRDVLSYRKKLLGYWTSEDNHGDTDFTTGRLGKRTRTDIGYHRNDDQQNYSVVFEFKKLDRHERSRKHYYGDSGMLRFVTGTYSKKGPTCLHGRHFGGYLGRVRASAENKPAAT